MLTLGLVVRKVSRAFSDDIATSQLYVFTPTMCVDQTTTWTYSSAKHFAFLTSPHHCGLDVAASERANVDGCPTRRVLQSVTADVSSDGIDVPSTYRTDGQAYAATRSAARDAILQSRSDDIKQRFVRAAGDHAVT